ncbi:MAG TPA: thioesterase family protein [Bacteroidota bacterium]|nr:thioesterase family protein [Bacteroidota bacterium]
MPPDEHRPGCIELQFRPKTYDIDFAGHVSNIVYIRWLEDLRLSFLDKHLPLSGLMEHGVAPVVMRTTIEYKKAVKLFDAVEGKMWIKDVGNVKGTLAAEFAVNHIVVAKADQEGLFVKLDTGRPVAFPDEFKIVFEAAGGNHK